MKRTAFFLLITTLLCAAPAFERTRTFVQPDGSSFSGTIRGDEYLHWIETSDGDIVAFNKQTGRYERISVGADRLRFSGQMYRPDNGTAKKASARNVSGESEALKALWLKKREAEMRRRQGK